MIRFDTRLKKPKLWNIAALSGVLAAVVAVFFLLGAERYAVGIALTIDLYLIAVLILLLRAFYGQLQYNPYSLCEQLENRFDRITLVNKGMTERLTIDINLKFHNIATNNYRFMDHIAIIELKRDGRVYSPILSLLNLLRIKPHGFSKYCIGSALTNSDLHCNRLKPRLHSIERILIAS